MQKIQVIMLLISLLLLTACEWEYRDHFIAEHSKPIAISSAWGYIVRSDDALWILPDKNIKNKIIESIESAKSRVWIEIYMWTDKDILAAMIQAHDRGVDVRVILEGNVYGLPYANATLMKTLKDAKIPVIYADTYRYTFTHAKFWLVDDRFFISTGNLTRSFFEGNRDFIFSSSDTRTRDFLAQLFSADYAHGGIDKAAIPSYIVLSPVDARSKIERLLTSAKKDIIVYTQTLTDESMQDILEQQQEAWVRVRVCTANNESNTESASGTPLTWTFLKKPYLHAKIIVVDGDRVFLGSQNLTKNSLENNREVGIIFSPSSEMDAIIANSFGKDCIFR